MSTSKKISNIIEDQAKLQKDLNNLADDLKNETTLIKAEKLEEEMTLLKQANEKMKVRLQKLENQNQLQKMSLLNLGAAEKNRILSLSKKGREIYFENNKKNNEKKLASLEHELDSSIGRLENKQYLQLGNKGAELLQEIEDFSQIIKDKINALRQEMNEQQKGVQQEIQKNYQYLEKQPVTEEQMVKRQKRNQWEMKIGLKMLNKAGIILVLISVGFLAYYARNSYTQAALITLLGGLFLGFAEFFYRRGRRIFSQTLMGGGVGILYSAVFFSHFVLMVNGLPLLGRNMALVLVTVVTLFTLILAWFRNSESILNLGLLGGFLPFVAYMIDPGFQGPAVFLAMIYLLVINLAVLVMSFFKEWRVSGILSFCFQTPALVYLISKSPSKGVSLIYLFTLFALYLAVVLLPRFRLDRQLKIPDIILLAVNSLTTGVLSFYLIGQMGIYSLRAGMALIFAALYFFLARKVQSKEKKQTGEFLLFIGTSLAFALWMIPVTFGLRGLTLGFLLEALILIVLGHRRSFPYLEKAGWAAFWGTLGTLLFWLLVTMDPIRDLLSDQLMNQNIGPLLKELIETSQIKQSRIIHWNLILFTLGSITISINYTGWLKDNSMLQGGKRLLTFRYLTLALTFFTLLGETNFLLGNLENLPALIQGDLDFAQVLLASLLSVIFTISVNALPYWNDRVVRGIGMATFFIGAIFWGTFLLDWYSPNDMLQNPGFQTIGLLSLAALYNAVLLWYGGRLVAKRILEKKDTLGSFPIVYSILIMVNAALFIAIFFPVETPALLYGFTFLFAAFLLIWQGFRKTYPPLRILGLITLFLSLLILLIPIVSNADPLLRIISFLVYGLLMLGISLIYQNISLKMENDEN